MQPLNDLSKTIAGMSPSALVTIIILAAFALCAYTISAIVKISKGQGRGR